jgi:hypothetical protein
MPYICTCILCIVFMYIICVCVAFVVLRVRMLCVPMGWCILCGLRPCALYTEPVKRKIERIHAPTGSTSGVPGSEAGNMMHPVYVGACVQKARVHAHGIRWRCTVRANASSTHACMWRTHMGSCVSTGSCQGGDTVSNKRQCSEMDVCVQCSGFRYKCVVCQRTNFVSTTLSSGQSHTCKWPSSLPNTLAHAQLHMPRHETPGANEGLCVSCHRGRAQKRAIFCETDEMTNGATVSLRTQLPHRCSLLRAPDCLRCSLLTAFDRISTQG